ncbi:permease [Cenarchaeum symbiosum A]|uniref:Permease n=1 Tax=Cenarchaeum symbiosum (strain A) TaxID=414004 RepID=A0RXB5_CENSY|nr:permease [Cenarchaeum symbiosum A]
MPRPAAAFAAELAGTFGLVAAATGSIVLDAWTGHQLGIGFVAAAHFAALAVLVYLLARRSGAHLNPAVTAGLVAAGRMAPRMAPAYLAAQVSGAVLASLAVRYAAGPHVDIGMTVPGEYSMMTVFGAEALATAILVAVVLAAGVRPAVAGVAIGGTVALEVLLLGHISGASMNPARSLGPAVVSGVLHDLWLYIAAPSIGAISAGAASRAARRMRRRASA